MCEIPKCKCGAKAELHEFYLRCSDENCDEHVDYLEYEWREEMKEDAP